MSKARLSPKPVQIKIQKNVPVPEVKQRLSPISELLMKLQVGDSFVVPATKCSNVWVRAHFLGLSLQSRPESLPDGTRGRRFWVMELK